MKLSYIKMRNAIKILTGNETFKAKYAEHEGEFLSTQFLDAIMMSGIDLELLKELTGKDPETIETEEAVDVMIDFFTHIVENWKKLSGLLGNLGFTPQAK